MADRFSDYLLYVLFSHIGISMVGEVKCWFEGDSCPQLYVI